jgi:DNA polymerase-3 subunit epsilon
MKILFFDLETTGLNPDRNAIHQLAGYVEIDGVIKQKFDFKIQPHFNAVIDAKALEISGKTKEEIMQYPESKVVFGEFKRMLNQYTDPYNTKDKFFLCGFNNASFDNQFLRGFFNVNGDKYFGSWFWSNTLDVMVLATQYLQNKRIEMPNFKLVSVASAMGLDVDVSKAHDGLYDIELTYQIYKRIIAPNPL